MANYLVDTSILIDVLRNHSAARKWIDKHNVGELAISFVTAAELSIGCRNKREQLAVAKDLTDYSLLWASDAVQQQSLLWLQQFRLSHGIGFLDCLNSRDGCR